MLSRAKKMISKMLRNAPHPAYRSAQLVQNLSVPRGKSTRNLFCPVSIRCIDDMRLEETNVVHSLGFSHNLPNSALPCIVFIHSMCINGDNMQLSLY